MSMLPDTAKKDVKERLREGNPVPEPATDVQSHLSRLREYESSAAAKASDYLSTYLPRRLAITTPTSCSSGSTDPEDAPSRRGAAIGSAIVLSLERHCSRLVAMSEKLPDRLTESCSSSRDKLEALVKSADMTDDMQQESIEVAQEAMSKYTIEKDIAQHIKRTFDDRKGPTWHCIVGRNFGSFVTHETKHFIYFYLGHCAILLFKTQ
ncbi:hypothetical protein XA68_10781 [Ophiocordyceps unilateralis]|uniref:Dynein light chain n=1 Tax=Ophiocordyceps unilateralis TaxID=268505 RepID=A0A2A9PGS2_OPHUN|nr:hypothetical protein XA68_10781 [Ophiocordyceps unilateralis]